MGAAREKRRAERIVEGGTPTWRQTWSELKASEWTHKKPHANSIETRWKLIPPGGKARGIEGTVHVLGEERECAQYTSGDIVDIRTSKDRDDEFELVPRDRALRPRFSADTSIGTSLFGPSDEDDSDDEVTIFDDDDGDFDNDNAVGDENSYADLRKDPFGPTPDAMKWSDSPLAIFFNVLSVALWQHNAVCSNNYKHEQTDVLVEVYFDRRKKYAASPAG
ncbi:uncharacterized protein PITG_07476 [Phytophthora infestans T30-4]|uniref:Uncharacterized protein n=1 Tax=Phytophthora infestans (strain T30-4) TaxID=403677 RepID=D0N8H1_PHYIT|nr:uncharacterized protein PITG_07476 [Phytophthora infestans T30-4]EEY53856.1 conserved hypothetical protein [Phytophthora infestans T30-4]|eukprot:XP_002904487.1 conserved hypothetical protein [Phytophthora infestans T30-4]